MKLKTISAALAGLIILAQVVPQKDAAPAPYSSTSCTQVAGLYGRSDYKVEGCVEAASLHTGGGERAAADTRWSKRTRDELARVMMLDLYRSSLRDPASAQFRDVRLLPSGAIEGYVNARNGFGGFTGWRKFRFGA